MHVCNLIALFIKSLYMFLLPDVVSADIALVAFIAVVLSLTSVPTALTEILNMILSYKYILHVSMYIHISEYVRATLFDIFFNFFQYINMHM